MSEGYKVLSLFNGMGCIWIALDRLGVKVSKRYASEIDKYANIVNDANYPDTIHLGDVTKVSAWDLENIDLLVGGSPCQGFSFAGKGLNFEDPRSKLFFEFVRIYEGARDLNPKVKFLLENVKMKKEHQDVISGLLGVQPLEINSALVSAQNRRRLYWTNIEGVTQPEDRGILLKDIIEHGDHIKYNCTKSLDNPRVAANIKTLDRKAVCMTRTMYKGTRSNGMTIIKEEGEDLRGLTPIECERLQTVPDNYTNFVSNTQRYKMLGNGWNVDTIVEVLRPFVK